MKTPIDTAAGGAGATVALLNSGIQFQMLDLWKITLNGGTAVRWHGGAGDSLYNAARSYFFTAAGGQPTVANGTYLKGPLIQRGQISTKMGLEAATLDVTISASLNDLINGTPIIPFTQGRGFDGASVVLYRAFLSAWGQNITGAVVAFSGRVTSISNISRSQITMTVSSWTVLLDVNMGPDVFQAGCLNTHYDADCGLTPTLGTSMFNGTVASGTHTATGFNTNLTNADHFFDKGSVLFTSGANNGLKRTTQTFLNASGIFSFAYGFPVAPAIGDTFIAKRGCLLNMIDCTAQGNLIHFRGQPFTPPAVQGVVG